MYETSSGAGGNSGGEPIKINIETFTEDVNTIEATGTTIIDDSADVAADAAIIRNATVPNYVTADERIEAILRNLQTETQQSVGSLRKIAANYCDVDRDASASIEKKGSNVPLLSR